MDIDSKTKPIELPATCAWPTDESGNKIHWPDLFKVHPAAAMWPILPDDEIRELAEDIKKNGLQADPVFWKSNDDKTVYLIDGRCRLEACERGGIELPWVFGPVSGAWSLLGASFLPSDVDPIEFIISVNAMRRHLTKQQRAELIVKTRMIAAKNDQAMLARSFNPTKGKKGGSTKDPVRESVMKDCAVAGISKPTARRAWDSPKNDLLTMSRSIPAAPSKQSNQAPKPKRWSTSVDSSAPKRDRIAAVWALMGHLKIKHADLAR